MQHLQIGILGGGQLGLMTAQANAKRKGLNLDLHFLDKNKQASCSFLGKLGAFTIGDVQNKREVVALRTRDLKHPVAIDTVFLAKHPIHHLKVGNDRVVILTNKAGESRVYESSDTQFKSWNGESLLTDAQGKRWQVAEAQLTHSETQSQLKRYPSHQSFLFGWHAQFPNTQLVK